MSGFNPRRLPTKTSHFLCYPLYSPRSSLQLQNLVKRLRDDQLTLHCPQKAFRMPKSFNLRILYFDFRTQQAVEAASELLRNLDINRMLANLSNQNQAATKATMEEDGHKARVSPLSVSLVGLHTGFRTDEELQRAEAIASDSTNRLQLLSTQIVQRFVSAGIENTKTFKSFSPQCQVINTWKARHRRRIIDDDGAKTSSKEVAPYDTRALVEKYKDVVLGESIPLEKLSLCNTGRISTFNKDKILVDEFHEEVESIPLPQ